MYFKNEQLIFNIKATEYYNQETTKEFLAVVESIKSLYPEGSMSNGDAHQAARNFIEFVKIMLEVERRKQKEKELLDKEQES